MYVKTTNERENVIIFHLKNVIFTALKIVVYSRDIFIFMLASEMSVRKFEKGNVMLAWDLLDPQTPLLNSKVFNLNFWYSSGPTQ